jgi:CO/xanthine dehydrogenase Mo-binding subunit
VIRKKITMRRFDRLGDLACNAVDVKVPGMLHARNVKPPVAGAKLISIEESSVRGLPGVLAALKLHACSSDRTTPAPEPQSCHGERSHDQPRPRVGIADRVTNRIEQALHTRAERTLPPIFSQ